MAGSGPGEQAGQGELRCLTAPPRGTAAGSLCSAGGAVSALLLLAACGNEATDPDTAKSPSGDSSSSAPAAPALADGDWLVAVTTAEGADAEVNSTVYVTYNPTTGASTARKVAGVVGGSADGADAALLVSADRKWAIPDTDIARGETGSGQVTVYSTADAATKKLDLRAMTGEKDLKPVAHAFDPQRPETLRVVDTRDRVYAVDVATGQATSEGRLTQGPWVYTNGFNRNSGVPWVESIDSDATMPAGNGVADTGPVTREQGTVLPSESEQLAALPQSPCRLGGGFTAADGTSYVFCADAAELTAYSLAKDATKWAELGKPSSAVAPAASSVPLVLPPVE